MAAPDFYFAINATFRFILDNYGEQALYDYWRAMGTEYYAPLSERFRTGGLDEVAKYWSGFFDAEPGANARVMRHAHTVEIEVIECPAIRWLRRHNRAIVPQYCQHCLRVSAAIAEKAVMEFTIEGGGGALTCSYECRSTIRTVRAI